MLRFTLPGTARPGSGAPSIVTVTLDHEERRRARFRAALSDGRDAAFDVPRGGRLVPGQRLLSDDGTAVVEILARAEPVSIASTDDAHLLTRAAYHLGNRHVPLAVEPGRVVYRHDHVLDDLCRELGLQVSFAEAPFEPEAGGYTSSGHSHGRGHDGHSHAHGHDTHAHGTEHDHPESRSRAIPTTPLPHEKGR